jgi:hypothetical protein
MRTHTITTQGRVGRRGRVKRRIVPGGILALSLAVLLMGATASNASADVQVGRWDCPPPSTGPPNLEGIAGCFQIIPSLDFGYHRVGMSTSQRFALGVREETFFNPRIGVSGDYAQTNTCPPTLSAGVDEQDGCLITVTFTPTGKGPRPGTLTTGPGGPTVALTGNGEPRDRVPPDIKLSGDKTQDPQNDTFTDGDGANVKVKVSCGDEWCTARATGRLTNVKQDKLSQDFPRDIEPGETRNMGPELTKESQRKQVQNALDKGEKVEAKVAVRAKDTSGNVATAKRTIRLVK